MQTFQFCKGKLRPYGFFPAFCCTTARRKFHPSAYFSTNDQIQKGIQNCQAVMSFTEVFAKGRNFRRAVVQRNAGRKPNGLAL